MGCRRIFVAGLSCLLLATALTGCALPLTESRAKSMLFEALAVDYFFGLPCDHEGTYFYNPQDPVTGAHAQRLVDAGYLTVVGEVPEPSSLPGSDASPSPATKGYLVQPTVASEPYVLAEGAGGSLRLMTLQYLSVKVLGFTDPSTDPATGVTSMTVTYDVFFDRTPIGEALGLSDRTRGTAVFVLAEGKWCLEHL